VTLSDQQAAFIRQRIGDGHYQDASEVIRAALRLLEQREAEDQFKLQTLRRLANEGFAEIDRGEFVEVEPGNLDQFMDALYAEALDLKAR
jgi:antitoxin ParD1/3/4